MGESGDTMARNRRARSYDAKEWDDACPSCTKGIATFSKIANRDAYNVNCPICTSFMLSGRMANQFQVVGREDHRLHRYLPAAIRIRREEGKSVGVDYDNWRDLAREVADKPFSWKKRRFLEIVDDRSEYEYGSVSFQWNDYPLFGCGSIEELHDLVTGLNDDNYIQLDEQSMSLNSFRCRLGTEGKEWLQGSPSYLELFGTETSGLPKDVHAGLLKCLRRRRDGDISGAMTAACGVRAIASKRGAGEDLL